jgi:glutamate decarboxylase
VVALLTEYVKNVPSKSVNLASPADIVKAFAAGVSLDLGEAHSQDDLLAACKTTMEYSVATSHPLFFNQLYGRTDPVALAGEWLSSTLNTNVHTFEVAPVFSVIEDLLLKKMASFVGPEFAANYDGLFVPGGSISNLYGMHLARDRVTDSEVLKVGLKANAKQLVAFTSEHAHYSYLKSARLTGIGTDNLIRIKTNDGAMCALDLEEKIKAALEQGKQPFFVGCTAGTTVHGAFDPFNEIAAVAKKYGHLTHSTARISLNLPTHPPVLVAGTATSGCTWTGLGAARCCCRRSTGTRWTAWTRPTPWRGTCTR